MSASNIDDDDDDDDAAANTPPTAPDDIHNSHPPPPAVERFLSALFQARLLIQPTASPPSAQFSPPPPQPQPLPFRYLPYNPPLSAIAPSSFGTSEQTPPESRDHGTT
ncbi:hypothetical protein NX059_012027 [Plenodomus lindquistii]|nr:hypothetical protein NX059_012027 [Plenodomus lindquistii]